MNISGQYNIYFSWGCNTTFNSLTITFNADGTFSTDDGGSGKWSQTNAYIIWRYEGDSAIYAGTVSGGMMNGSMVNFKLNMAGCFYGNLSTNQVLTTAAVNHDSSGAEKPV